MVLLQTSGSMGWAACGGSMERQHASGSMDGGSNGGGGGGGGSGSSSSRGLVVLPTAPHYAQSSTPSHKTHTVSHLEQQHVLLDH